MRKVLIVAYSYTGTSRRVARRLADAGGWTIGELFDAKPRSGWLRCVLDSMLRRRPAIRYEGPDPAGFDTVVLVSPIWVEGLSAPMRTFVTEQASRLRSFAVVSVMGSRGAPNAVAEISRITGRSPILTAAFKQREVDAGSAAEGIREFARAVERVEAVEPAPVQPRGLAPIVGSAPRAPVESAR